MLHLCMPVCAPRKEKWLLPHLVCQKLDCIGSSRKRGRRKQRRKQKHYSVSWLLWVRWSMVYFVGVSGCMSPGLHPSSVLSFSLFLWAKSHTHTYTHSSSPNTLRDVSRCSGEMLAGRMQVCLWNLQRFVLKAALWIMGVGGGGWAGLDGSAEEKWSPSSTGWRLGRLAEIFMSLIWRETKQLIGTRQLSLCLQRRMIHFLLLIFLCPVSWIWFQSYCWCRPTICMHTTLQAVHSPSVHSLVTDEIPLT